jgi:hypothetical protein
MVDPEVDIHRLALYFAEMVKYASYGSYDSGIKITLYDSAYSVHTILEAASFMEDLGYSIHINSDWRHGHWCGHVIIFDKCPVCDTENVVLKTCNVTMEYSDKRILI